MNDVLLAAAAKLTLDGALKRIKELEQQLKDQKEDFQSKKWELAQKIIHEYAKIDCLEGELKGVKAENHRLEIELDKANETIQANNRVIKDEDAIILDKNKHINFQMAEIAELNAVIKELKAEVQRLNGQILASTTIGMPDYALKGVQIKMEPATDENKGEA